MSKLKIGYIPYSPDMGHPADRRRVVYWAKKRGHEIILDLNQKHDVLFLSSRADLTRCSKLDNQTPLIIELVDGYLGKEHLWRDFVRGAGKVVIGGNLRAIRPFQKILIDACRRAQAVVCATVEQSYTILPYCSNTHLILDFHEEFPLLPFNAEVRNDNFPAIMWEGLPFTAKGLLLLDDAFLSISRSSPLSLEMVTDFQYPLLLGKFLYQDTMKILKSIPTSLGDRFRITEWNLTSVVNAAQRSHMAVLPLDPSGTLNSLKAENRLLIMWRIGLPTLASPSLAYQRVMKTTGLDGICSSPGEWQEKITGMVESVQSRRESVERGQQYIRDTHSEKLLLEAWDRLFESVI